MISCQTHDYLEIACLYGFAVRIRLHSDELIEGKAITTETSADKREWLIVEQHSERISIELQQIKSMQALSPNPHFDLITFEG